MPDKLENLATTPLMYHGKPMRWEPENIPEGDLIYDLQQGKTVHVVLEPGDATRYDLFLIWGVGLQESMHLDYTYAKRSILVVRFSTDATTRGAALFNAEDLREMEKLAPNNAWTLLLFIWWLNLLVEKLNG